MLFTPYVYHISLSALPLCFFYSLDYSFTTSFFPFFTQKGSKLSVWTSSQVMRSQGTVALICPLKELYRDFVQVWEMSLWFLLKGKLYKHSHQRRQNTKSWRGLSRKPFISKRWILNKRNMKHLIAGNKFFHRHVFHQRCTQHRTVSNLLLRRSHGDT